MPNKTPTFQFPSEWNSTNERALEQYNTCGVYYDNKEDFVSHYKKGFTYHAICVLLLIYTIINCGLIIKFRKNYVISKYNLSMIMLYILSVLINIITSYLSQVKYYTFPCYILSYSVVIGYPLLFFVLIGFILRYIKICYSNSTKYIDIDLSEEDGGNKYKIGRLINKYYTDERLISIVLLIVIISLIYITGLTLSGGSFTLFPLEEGFCELNYEHILNYAIMDIFLIIILPTSLIEIYKLGKKFPSVRTYKFSIIILFILLAINIFTSYIKSFKCSVITKYIPYDIPFLLLNIVFVYTQLTKPLIDLVKTEIKIHKLEVSKKSLISVLNSNLLYDEFLDYCNKKCCGEYAIFHREYMRYRRCYKPISEKNLDSQFFYDSYDFTNSTFSMSCVSVLTTNTQIATNFENDGIEVSINMQNMDIDDKKRKMSTATSIDNKSSVLRSVMTDKNPDSQEMTPDMKKNFQIVHKIMNEINFKFFEKEATLELNIPDRIIKRVKRNLNVFNDNYEKMCIGQSYNREGLNCERIFDEAHRECIETIYHNVFSNYLSYKKNNSPVTDVKESKDGLDGPSEIVSIKRNVI